jgi:hypothetical protein
MVDALRDKKSSSTFVEFSLNERLIDGLAANRLLSKKNNKVRSAIERKYFMRLFRFAFDDKFQGN